MNNILKVQEIRKSASVGPQCEVEGGWVSSDPFKMNEDVPLPYCCKVTAYRSNHIKWVIPNEIYFITQILPAHF